MKYILFLATLSLTLPAHAMEKAKPQSISDQFKEIRSLITKTIAGITKTSFSRTQKQTLHSQLSIVQEQHDTVTTSIEKKERYNTLSEISNAQLEAVLKTWQEKALAQHKKTLRTIEEVEKEEKKTCFFEPNDPLLGSVKKAVIDSIKMHEKMLANE
jgi:hypothetical protein